jgi:ribonuclease P protein component
MPSALGLRPAGPDRACRSKRAPSPWRESCSACCRPPAPEGLNEADISAEQPQEGEDARLSPSYVDARWPGDHPGSPPARASSPDGIGSPDFPGCYGLRPPPTVRDAATFARLASIGRRGRSGPVAVRFLAGNEAGRVLFAYSVGRRYGSAVQRNRCRRRLRAIAAEAAPNLLPGAYLVEVRRGAESCGYGELRNLVLEAIRRASLAQPASSSGVAGTESGR